jgi:hypothetical protein
MISQDIGQKNESGASPSSKSLIWQVRGAVARDGVLLPDRTLDFAQPPR